MNKRNKSHGAACSWAVILCLIIAAGAAAERITTTGLTAQQNPPTAPESRGSATAPPFAVIRARDFLSSLGAVAKFDQGADAAKTASMVRYLGLRSLRSNGTSGSLIALHNQTGVRFDVGLSSGPSDNSIGYVLELGRALAKAGALLALEGANEPNNFGATYHGHACCLHGSSWTPVAEMQRDFYRAVKTDPVLKIYPVFGVSEVGAETNNVGLQYLTIPPEPRVQMAAGTNFADYVNAHNYVSSNCHTYRDNQAYYASVSYSVPCFDGIWGENGITWARGFRGYSRGELDRLQKVTTETGWWTDGTGAGDDRQGKILLNTYLDQYRLGWKYTFVYEIMDFSDGKDGFYANYDTPRVSATYLHNLTMILADNNTAFKPSVLAYSISGQPETVHDMLMQKSNGFFELAIWGELVSGSSHITVRFESARPSLAIYDPTVSAVPLKVYNRVESIPISITDHVIILQTR